MNTGLQDAANLAWKLALVIDDVADAALLDSFEAERKPAAQLVADGGDDFEHVQLVADPAEHAVRDEALRSTFATEASRHHEAVAHAELNIDYAGSPIVGGDPDEHLGPGDRMPDTIAVVPADGGPDRLHAHAHRSGHTVVILGSPSADAAAFRALVDGAQAQVDASPRLDAALAFAALDDRQPGVGAIDAGATDELGVQDVTVFAIRPDGYVGLRADGDHLAALAHYDALVRAATRSLPASVRRRRCATRGGGREVRASSAVTYPGRCAPTAPRSLRSGTPTTTCASVRRSSPCSATRPPDAEIHLAAIVGGIGANQAEPGRFFFENALMGIELCREIDGEERRIEARHVSRELLSPSRQAHHEVAVHQGHVYHPSAAAQSSGRDELFREALWCRGEPAVDDRVAQHARPTVFSWISTAA